jgi:uncharacterized spore protein YtfJ
MLKNYVCIEIKKNERTYRFNCENDSPLGETYDVLTEMLAYVCEKIKEVQMSQKKAQDDNKSESACGSCG